MNRFFQCGDADETVKVGRDSHGDSANFNRQSVMGGAACVMFR